MSIRLFLTSAILALSAFCNQTQAQTWTVTTTGHISNGSDGKSLFGNLPDSGNWNPRDLYGLAYTESITVSTDPAQWNPHAGEPSNSTQALYGNGPGFSVTVTVNGHTATFSAAVTVDGVQDISKDYGDKIQTYMLGIIDGLQHVHVNTFASSQSEAFVPIESFSQSHSFSQDVSGSAFDKQSSFFVTDDITGGGPYTSFEGIPDFISVTVSAVPELETYAMLLAGLGLIGAIARRKHMTL